MFKIIGTIGLIQVVVVFVNLLRTKLTAVFLGVEGVGIISVIDHFIQLVVHVGCLSLPFAALKFLSLAHSTDAGAFQAGYASMLRLLILLTTVTTAIALVISVWAPSLLGPGLALYGALLIPALLKVPAVALHGYLINVLAAAQRTRASAMFLLVIAASLTLSTAIGIAVGGLEGFYWANLLASYALVFGMLLFLKTRLGLRVRGGGQRLTQALQDHPKLVSFSLIMFVASMTQPLALFVGRYTLLAHFGDAEAGLLQGALGLAMALAILVNPLIGLYLAPALNRDIPKPEKLAIALEFQRRLLMIVAVLAMPVVLFPEWLLTLLYSSAFTSVAPQVFWFVVAQYILLIATVFPILMIGLDNLKMYAITLSLSQLAMGLCAWLGVPHYGISAVAAGFLLSSVMLFAMTLFDLRLRHGLRIPPKTRWLYGYGIIGLLLAGWLFARLDTWQPEVIVAKVGVYVLFGSGFLAFLEPLERRRLVHEAGNLYRRLKR